MKATEQYFHVSPTYEYFSVVPIIVEEDFYDFLNTVTENLMRDALSSTIRLKCDEHLFWC